MYVVLLNGSYLNSFKDYGKAKEFQEIIRRQFPKADIEIIWE